MKDYKLLALLHAEDIGVIEYSVSGSVMSYWTLYDDGFWFVEYDLLSGLETRELEIPYIIGDPVPEFLLSAHGGTLYNYFEG